MSYYSIYKPVNPVYCGDFSNLEVSQTKFALINEANIQRYETIEVAGGCGPENIVVAVSDNKYFQPLNNISYKLQTGIDELNRLINSQKEVDELDVIRSQYTD